MDDISFAINCIICKKSIVDAHAVTLSQKGSNSINHASAERDSDIEAHTGDKVHSECRKTWCNPNSISAFKRKCSTETAGSFVKRRSQGAHFDFKTHCVLCGLEASVASTSRKTCEVFAVRTHDFRRSIIETCNFRNDQWSVEVSGRLAFAEDLPAADALYHQQCSVNFRTGRMLPLQHDIENSLRLEQHHLLPGRPQHSERHNSFMHVISYLEENDDEQLTVGGLVNVMKQHLESSGSDEAPYSEKYMKKKLLEHFGEKVIIATVAGRSDVVTFHTTANAILQEYYGSSRKDNEVDEKMRIITVAAKLIASDIKALVPCVDVYPSSTMIDSPEKALQYIPDSLCKFLELVIGKKNDKKVASIGQAMMQASRPRTTIMPLQLGLAVQLHHHFCSRFLIETLHQHGFCSSYKEVQKYERNAATTSSLDTSVMPNQFVQYVADNVDHNVCTIDGHATFHGMGMIAAVTPGGHFSRTVKRAVVTSDDVIRAAKINVTHWNQPHDLNKVEYKSILGSLAPVKPESIILDTLWKLSPFVKQRRPSWSGFMEMAQHGEHPGKSTIVFLPMIDMDPTDVTCIHSCLTFLCQQALSNNAKPIVTFDQPLWWKAYKILAHEPDDSLLKKVVLLLGGFHTEMCFLGCIGHIMDNSGIEEVLQAVYGSNAVVHMLNGKSVSRARRGHFLVDAALNILLASEVFGLPLPFISSDCVESEEIKQHSGTDQASSDSHTAEDSNLISEVKDCYEKVLAGMPLEPELRVKMQHIASKLEKTKVIQKDSSRTAALWIQYMHMVDVLKQYLYAERTGDWLQHLESLRDMLPYFAAAGRNLYTKSVYAHLQEMINLQTSHPDVYEKFLNGYHVLRRSSKFWAGLSADIVIEQELMRSVKSTGGLTRGRGFTEAQRHIWVESMGACNEINVAMQQFTGVQYCSSHQHKDIFQSRQARDAKDVDKFLRVLSEISPFTNDASLRNITSGVTAHHSVNVDDAVKVGHKILDAMPGQVVWDYSFQRKHQAVTMAVSSKLNVKNENIHIDPQLLFQRLVVITTTQDIVTEDLFKYELCTYPPALFDSMLLLRSANKAALAESLWKLVKGIQDVPVCSSTVQYILDGGALLHRIPWSIGSTWMEICNCYVRYVMEKYNKAIVVFDGYNSGPNTKDATHAKRCGPGNAPVVHCLPNLTMQVRKDRFLANSSNKQCFIDMLSDYLNRAGCQTKHAKGDADLLIVQTAINEAHNRDIVVVADDTDILVLLCYYVTRECKQVTMRPEPKRLTVNPRVWNIQAAQSALGGLLCKNLLFIHALLGCDTTSQLYGIGKKKGLQILKNNSTFVAAADTFNNPSAAVIDVVAAGEKALVAVYGGVSSDNLNKLRYRKFTEMISRNTTCVQPQTLPPTSSAAKFHSQRVYYQVQLWQGNTQLDACQWGWELRDGRLAAIMTDLQAAPTSLLEVIRCNCKTDCKTLRCSCRKHNLDCSSACGECQGISCTNCSVNIPTLDDDDQDSASDTDTFQCDE